MRKVLSLFLLALSVFSLAADDSVGARIEFVETVHDFGNIDEKGGPVRWEFEFVNTGDEPLVIISASASCGCTRPSFTKEPIKPGKKGVVKVTFLPDGRPGEFTKSIKVKTNAKGKKRVTLKIKGVVVPAPLSIE